MDWQQEAQLRIKKMPREALELRERAFNDLCFFARLVNPGYMYGSIHMEVYRWMQDYTLFGQGEDRTSNKLIMLPRGHLKALRLDQRVITPNGWVETGDLKIGDFVYGQDGKAKKVLQLHPISEMPLYKVTTRTGRQVVCNEEHLWNVICPSSSGSEVVTKPLKDILTNYKSKRFDKRNGKEYEECRYFLPNISPVDLPEKDLPIDPFVLGAWLGDGTSSQGSITSADPELMEEIGLHYEVIKHSSKYDWDVLGLMQDLKDLGVLNNKHIPKDYLEGSIEQRLSLLQGLMDTDGTVQSCGTISSFSNTNKNLVDGVVSLVRSLGGVATVVSVSSSCNGKMSYSWQVTIKMQGIKPFRLKRKLDRLSDSRTLREAIVNIERVEDGKARCITVEGGLFITEDYTLTHNSHMVATWCAWAILRNPEVTILYLSATAELANIQLYDIQNILSGNIFMRYFPEYIHPQEGKREKWCSTSIIIDHPQRFKEGIRDSTVKTAGLTTNTTGWHADIIVSDDLVVPENAYTSEGRDSVTKKASQFTSIRNAGGFTLACGTRYHPSDVYQVWKDQVYDVYNDEGEKVDQKPIWEIVEYAVETDGLFIWPRAVRGDGKAFGFNIQELSRIKGEYTDKVQFYAQYYNDPNDPMSERISYDKFQYYNPRLLTKESSKWSYNGNRLNVYAAVDFAFSLSKKADYTAIVVIGIDCDGNIYVLDIDRFKTDKTSEYHKHIRDLHSRWSFTKLRAEVTVAQKIIVNDIKDFVRRDGMRLSVEEFRPTGRHGKKADRINAILEYRYDDLRVWHLEGGWTPALEEELVMARPAHDDIKDALASAVEIAVPPGKNTRNMIKDFLVSSKSTNSRFGGVNYR